MKRWIARRWKVVATICSVTVAILAVVSFRACSVPERSFELETRVPASGPPFASALFQSVGARMLPGHQLALLENGTVFDAVVAEANGARNSIHVLMYIWEKGVASDRVTSALVERAKAGVACRVLVDAFGSPNFTTDVQPALARAGCDVRLFRPSSDELARNHRKLFIFDGRSAITGGFGIRDNWLGDGVHETSWRDTNVRFSGPAVTDAQQAFAENWQEAGGSLLPPEAFPSLSGSGAAEAAFVGSSGAPVLTRAERLGVDPFPRTS